MADGFQMETISIWLLVHTALQLHVKLVIIRLNHEPNCLGFQERGLQRGPSDL